ncbi:MAG: hypothetical protein NTZ54_00915 [Alphaproteobacteria bacterium]|nr:hypothetical protein [Alphaproteobacteria bacterium]
MEWQQLLGVHRMACRVGEHAGQCLFDDDAERHQELIVGGGEQCEVKAHVGRNHGLGLYGGGLHVCQGFLQHRELFGRGPFGGQYGGAGFENASDLLQREQEGALIEGGAVPCHDVPVQEVPTLARFDARADLGARDEEALAIQRLDSLPDGGA